jgi:hypothetical protein
MPSTDYLHTKPDLLANLNSPDFQRPYGTGFVSGVLAETHSGTQHLLPVWLKSRWGFALDSVLILRETLGVSGKQTLLH